MAAITTVEELRRCYPKPVHPLAVNKVLDHLDQHCRAFLDLSPFAVLGTQAADGSADVSPRGEAPGFAAVIDDRHVAIPDRPGNNRLDSMTNILENPTVALIFLIPGVRETLRINGTAEIRDDDALRDRFVVNGRPPATVIVVRVQEAFLHCAKALMRSRLWDPETRIDRGALPPAVDMFHDHAGVAEKTPGLETDAVMDGTLKRELW